MLRNLNIKNFEDEIEINFTDSNHLAAHSNQSNQSMNNNDLTASKANDNPMFRQMIIMTLNHQW